MNDAGLVVDIAGLGLGVGVGSRQCWHWFESCWPWCGQCCLWRNGANGVRFCAGSVVFGVDSAGGDSVGLGMGLALVWMLLALAWMYLSLVDAAGLGV
jgi:hypothetical protein